MTPALVETAPEANYRGRPKSYRFELIVNPCSNEVGATTRLQYLKPFAHDAVARAPDPASFLITAPCRAYAHAALFGSLLPSVRWQSSISICRSIICTAGCVARSVLWQAPDRQRMAHMFSTRHFLESDVDTESSKVMRRSGSRRSAPCFLISGSYRPRKADGLDLPRPDN